MANTSFKVDNGLLVVGESDFLGNVIVSRNVTTGNLTVSNKLVVGTIDLMSDLAKSANTVRVSVEGVVKANSKQLNFKNSPTLTILVTEDNTTGNANIEFTVSTTIPGAQGFQGFQGQQGLQGVQGVQGQQGRQGIQGTQGPLGYSGLTYTYSNATSGDPASGNFRYNVNLPPFTDVTTIVLNRNDKFGNNAESYLTAWDDSTTTSNKGFLILKQYTNNLVSTFKIDSLTNNPSTGTITVTVSGSTGNFFTNGNDAAIDFYRTGDIGIQGNLGVQGNQGRQGALGAQGIAGTGAEITTSDDTSSSTLYPVLVPGTGAQAPKVSTSKFVFNASSGDLRVTGNTTTTLKAYTEAITFANVTSGSYSANLALTNIFDVILSRAGGTTTAITLINAPIVGTGSPATFIFRQSSSSANTVTWANTVYWSNGETPLLANGTTGLFDVVTIYAIAGSSYFVGAHSLAALGPASLP